MPRKPLCWILWKTICFSKALNEEKVGLMSSLWANWTLVSSFLESSIEKNVWRWRGQLMDDPRKNWTVTEMVRRNIIKHLPRAQAFGPSTVTCLLQLREQLTWFLSCTCEESKARAEGSAVKLTLSAALQSTEFKDRKKKRCCILIVLTGAFGSSSAKRRPS